METVPWSESKTRAFKDAEARFTTAWQKLLDAVRASLPRSESNKARSEYLDARAALEEHGTLFVTAALARCTRQDAILSGLSDRSDWSDDSDDDDSNPYGVPGNSYYRREREDAEEAERAVDSSMLPSERFDRIIARIFDGVGAIIGGLVQIAGAIFLLWGLIWLVKTLWFLS